MCTLVTLWKSHPETDLLIGLNRDEFLARDTAPLDRFEAEGVSLLGGRDLRSGGTWFAIGPSIVAGLTNDRRQGAASAGRLARGDLVLQAATARDLDDARARLSEVDAAQYGPFFLLCFGPDGALCLSNPGGVLTLAPVVPGPHVLGNFGLDAAGDPVVDSLRAPVAALNALPLDAARARLHELLATHGPGQPCVHLGPYGTRSSLCYARGPSGFLDVVESAPCQAAYTDRSTLLVPPDAAPAAPHS